MLAKFPVHVLVFVLGLCNVNINMWINLILQVAYIAVVVFMFNKGEAEQVSYIEDKEDAVTVIAEQDDIV